MIHRGDVRDKLKELEAESVHCVVTSPPYWGLRDYNLPPQVWLEDSGDCEHEWQPSIEPGGQGDGVSFRRDRKAGRKRGGHQPGFCIKCNAWRGSLGLEPNPALYIQHVVEVFREVRRVMRPDATCWLNMGDSYAATPKGSLAGQDKSGLTSTQTQENSPIGINKISAGLKPKDLCGIPWRLALALQADGWYWRRWIPWIKPNMMPGSEMDRPPGSGSTTEVVLMLAKSQKNYYDPYAIYDDKLYRDSHFFDESLELLAMRVRTVGFPGELCKRCKSYYPRGWGRLPRHIDEEGKKHAICSKCGKWDQWLSHYATFPETLIAPIIKLATSAKGCCPECGAPWARVVEKIDTGEKQKMPDGFDSKPGAHGTIHREGREKGESNKPVLANKTLGWRPTCECGGEPVPAVVLDPFLGSGTVIKVAQDLGREGIGIELSEDYCEMARERTRYTQELLRLG